MVGHGGVRLLLPGCLALVVLAGCSGGSGNEPAAAPPASSTCPAPSPAPPAQLALLPAKLSFDKVGTVTHVGNTAGHLTLQAVSTKDLDELTVLIQDAVTAAGYHPAGMDTEEDEAEVFFTTGKFAAGQARVRKATCGTGWTIDLDLITPGTTPSPTTPTP